MAYTGSVDKGLWLRAEHKGHGGLTFWAKGGSHFGQGGLT